MTGRQAIFSKASFLAEEYRLSATYLGPASLMANMTPARGPVSMFVCDTVEFQIQQQDVPVSVGTRIVH